MKRTTVMLPDVLDSRLRMQARARGVSVAQVVRDAVEEHLSTPVQSSRVLSFVGVVDDGPEDGSERVDEIVAAAIRASST